MLYVRTILHTGSQEVVVPHERSLVFAAPATIQRAFGSSSSVEPSAEAVASHVAEVEACRTTKLACSTPGQRVTFGWHNSGRHGNTFCKLDMAGPGIWFGLLGAPSDSDDGASPSFSTHRIISRLMPSESGELDTLLILPGCNVVGSDQSDCGSDILGSAVEEASERKRPRLESHLGGGAIAAGVDTEEVHAALYHIDESGRSCFTSDEARRASAHLAAGDFLGRLVRRVNTTAFVLPQSRVENHAFFCNEVIVAGAGDIQGLGHEPPMHPKHCRPCTANLALSRCTVSCASLPTSRSCRCRPWRLARMLTTRTRRTTTTAADSESLTRATLTITFDEALAQALAALVVDSPMCWQWHWQRAGVDLRFTVVLGDSDSLESY